MRKQDSTTITIEENQMTQSSQIKSKKIGRVDIEAVGTHFRGEAKLARQVCEQIPSDKSKDDRDNPRCALVHCLFNCIHLLSESETDSSIDSIHKQSGGSMGHQPLSRRTDNMRLMTHGREDDKIQQKCQQSRPDGQYPK